MKSPTSVLVGEGAWAQGPADSAAWNPLFDGKTLDGWKVTDFFPAGKVAVEEGLIVMHKGNQMSGVTYARKDFPRRDYEVEVVAKKFAGNDFFCTTTFPVGDAFCSLVVGGWGGRLVGISSINGADASQNETTKEKEFKAGQWYRIRVRVTAKKIQAWIDDERLVDLATEGLRLATRIECAPCEPFGLATYETTGAVREVRVRPLTDLEKK